ncbi:phage antirepressor [Bacillus cereus group sp. MYBK234-1]|uniref:phage antirepressor n=1 Tax=unclassified Bacillus cereus group TaxID=2750818 RepID=UPI003F797060
MNQLQTFKNEIFEVSAKLENGEVLFDVEQVAKSLGFTQKKNGKNYIRWVTVNGYLKKYVSQEVGKGDLIPEPLVYKLAFKASNEIAEVFQDWLAIEVLPTIRKHGAYMTDQVLEQAVSNPDFAIGLLTKLKEEKQKLAAAQRQIEQQRQKVLFADSVSAAETSILVRGLAKILRQNGVDTGEKRLFKWLRENGYLVKKKGADYNSPTQYSMELGLFDTDETSITRSSGKIELRITPKVTGKGQLYFINKFLGKNQTA